MNKTILYIPLDERPCNFDYPQQMLLDQNDIKLIVPKLEQLGNKKIAADITNLYKFIELNIKEADAFVFSIEMLMYGGLLPSRLHHLKPNAIKDFTSWLTKLKNDNRNVMFYASNLIMRTPQYSSSDEEPDYYEDYGRQIYREAYLKDQLDRFGLSKQELDEYEALVGTTPREYINDYETRRNFNVNVNLEVIELVNNGVIDFLSIPQDDSSPFGYTAIDQKVVYHKVKQARLQSRILIYPGADEVGCALVSRAIRSENTMKVYPIFSGYNGPNIIPIYEDRPIMNSLLSHLQVSNAILVDQIDDADIVLAYNTPGLATQEASEQENKDISYDSYRNLGYFVNQIDTSIKQGKRVVLADCAFGNGGDLELIMMLDDAAILDKLYVYKAWNTNCNTLGTSLAHGLLNISEFNRIYNLLYHIYDDVFYQGYTRKDITNNILENEGLNYFNLKDKSFKISNLCKSKLLLKQEASIINSFKDYKLNDFNVEFPWNRMFEIKLNLDLIKL